MVRHASLARQRLIFHFCETCKQPVRHASKSGHKECTFKEGCTYVYCLTCRSYVRSTEMANDDKSKDFIRRHASCAQENGRGGRNLTSKDEKSKLARLFAKEDRAAEGVLSQCSEPAKPPTKRKQKFKSRAFIDSDSSSSDLEVSADNCTS